MKKNIYLLSVVVIPNLLFSQKVRNNSLGISIPVIYNKSSATFYRLGSENNTIGEAVSSGININYRSTISKKIYTNIGVGFLKQKFAIKRPFKFDSPFNFGFSSESYSYNNISFFGGFGYNFKLNKKYYLKTLIEYNLLYSFQQKYIVNKQNSQLQINNYNKTIGNKFNLNIGVEKSVYKKITIGAFLILPLKTNWYKDEIFYNLGYSEIENRIAKNIFSIGTMFTCNYNF